MGAAFERFVAGKRPAAARYAGRAAAANGPDGFAEVLTLIEVAARSAGPQGQKVADFVAFIRRAPTDRGSSAPIATARPRPGRDAPRRPESFNTPPRRQSSGAQVFRTPEGGTWACLRASGGFKPESARFASFDGIEFWCVRGAFTRYVDKDNLDDSPIEVDTFDDFEGATTTDDIIEAPKRDF